MLKSLIAGVVCCFLLSCGNNDPDAGKQADREKLEKVKTELNDLKKKIPKDGPYEEFYPDGQLKMKGSMSAGKKEGEWQSFYPNGNRYSENRYANGLADGKTVSYYPNGRIRYIGYYTKGKPSGKWLIYNDQGEQIEEKDYGEVK